MTASAANETVDSASGLAATRSAVACETITIDVRFSGPSGSGNGGISAGLVAGLVDVNGTDVQVRLRRPPPLGRSLQVQRSDRTVAVTDAGEVVLEARAGTRPVDVPVDSEILSRIFTRGSTPVFDDHAAPDCFVCGPRDGGLGICPHRLPATELWATVWTPDMTVCSDGRTVDPHIVWGALDCPAGFAVTRYGSEPMTFFPALTCMTTHLVRPVVVGNPVAVIGWLIDEDERWVNGGTAIVDADGTVCATAHAQHARLPLSFGTG